MAAFGLYSSNFSSDDFAGLCLDLTNGDLTDGNPVQTWQCTDGNPNQVWFPEDVLPAPFVVQIHPNGNNAKCLDIRGAAFENGTPVQMSVVFILIFILASIQRN